MHLDPSAQPVAREKRPFYHHPDFQVIVAIAAGANQGHCYPHRGARR